MTDPILSVQPGHEQYSQSHINQQRDKDVGFPACTIKRNNVRAKERTALQVSVTTVGFIYIASFMSQEHLDNLLKKRGAECF